MPSSVTVTIEQKKNCKEKREEYIKQYELMIKEETNKIASIQNNFEYLSLAKTTLQRCGLQISIGYLNENFLSEKWDDSLLAARKDLVRCVQYLEKVYTTFLNDSFGYYEKIHPDVFKINEFERYNFLKYVGFYINFLDNLFIETRKWHWFFVELESRLTICFKNSLDLKNLRQLLDPRVEYYKERFQVLNKVRDLLRKAAQEYRMRYEITSFQKSDFCRAIEFLSAVRGVEVLSHKSKEVEELDREITVWKTKQKNDELDRNKDN